MTRIVRSPGVGRRRATCTAPVHLSEMDTYGRRARVAAAEKMRRPATECGRVSMYLVDGLARCLNHAGQDAIKIVMEQP